MSAQPVKKWKNNLEPTLPQIDINVHTVYTIFQYYYMPNFVFSGEYHEAWEILYVISGEVVIETDDGTFILKQGNAFLHKPNEYHKHRANNVACNTCVISFSADAEQDVLYKLAGHPLPVSEYMQSLIYRITDEGILYLAGKNYTPARLESDIVGFGCGQIIKNMLELLLIEFSRQENREYPEQANLSRSEKTLILSIKRYLIENLNRKLALEEIAKKLGYSVSHICSTFKKNVGCSIIHYFIKLRIEKAKELISESQMSLSEISDYLDFDTIQYFSTQFKKVVGVSPSQYASLVKSHRVIETDQHTRLI